MADAPPAVCEVARRQPKPIVRWLAIVLALAGWYLSLQLLRASLDTVAASPLVDALCGAAGGAFDCDAVLSAPQGYIPLSQSPDGPRLPVSIAGMAYFAMVAIWYLFIGPPTRNARYWHVAILLLVVVGVLESLQFIRIMAFELHRWCGSCLSVHAINGALLVLTVWAWPWRGRGGELLRLPTTRLGLAVMLAALLAGLSHLAWGYVVIAGTLLKERTEQYAAVLNDPDFLRWDFARQPAVSIPLRDEEMVAGATHTVVVFTDFQCTHCRRAHAVLADVLAKYGERIQVAYRQYPQDPACNANPNFKAGGHLSACRAAYAAEAVRRLNPDATDCYRDLLFARQGELPQVPFEQQSAAQQRVFAEWAVECGLEPDAVAGMMADPDVHAWIAADIALAEQLEARAMPVVFLDGKRLRNWSNLKLWAAVLDPGAPATTQPGQ